MAPRRDEATGTRVSERDPGRQLQRAVRKYKSDLIQAKEKLEKAIAIAEAIEHAARN